MILETPTAAWGARDGGGAITMWVVMSPQSQAEGWPDRLRSIRAPFP